MADARLTLALLGAVAVACGSSLRAPPRGPHLGLEPPLYVEYPPPPAQIEDIPPDPGGKCVWIDGHWEWLARRWEWHAGRWVVPPEGCYYAGMSLAWLPSVGGGNLSYLKARWYAEDAESLPPDQAQAKCARPVPCSPEAKPYRPPGTRR